MTRDVTVYSSGGAAVVPHGAQSGAPTGHTTYADELTPVRSNAPVKFTQADERVLTTFGQALSVHGVRDVRVLQAAREWYVGFTKEAQEEKEHADDADRTKVRAAMQREWGSQYGANIKRIRAWLDTLPGNVQDVLWEGETLDGVRAFNDPAVLRWLLSLAGGARQVPAGDVDREIREIEALIRNPRSEYWRGSRAEDIQARYRELLEMRG